VVKAVDRPKPAAPTSGRPWPAEIGARLMNRPQFNLRELMIGVIGCALVAVAWLRYEDWGWLFFLAGPVCGVLVHRAMGGRGIVGGTVGGGGSYLCIGVAIYAIAYFSPTPIVGDLVGFLLGLFLLTFLGATIGLIVGLFIWGILRSPPPHKRLRHAD
jgi:hypothetical protein